MIKHGLISQGCRSLTGILAFLWVSNAAIPQTTAGATTVLAAPTTVNAVDELVARYPYIINFEGPRYTYEGDFEDMPEQYRKPGAPIERRVKLNAVALSVPTGAIARDRMASILRQLIDQANVSDGGHFRLEQLGDTFNVIATEARDANGNWTAQVSLFDARITIPTQERSAYEMLGAILNVVAAANHTHLGLYDDRPGPLAPLETIRAIQGANNEVARDVLARTLALANRRFAWRTGYDRVTNKYYVTILLVGSKATVPITTTPVLPAVGAESNLAGDPDALVLRLRELPEHPEAAPPYNAICSGSEPCPVPPLPPLAAERHRIYDELYVLGPAGVAALARGLASSDVQLRRNVAVALGVLAVGWIHDRYPSRLDISAALPALMTALQDSDQHVRANAAFDLGDMRSQAAPAVGQLIEMLGDPDEFVRYSVCIGLGGIGPAAKAALPALWQALVDPSEHVRASAQFAIPSIEGRLRAPGER